MILFSKFFNEIFIWESITVLLKSLYVIFSPCCSPMNKLANSFFKENSIRFFYLFVLFQKLCGFYSKSDHLLGKCKLIFLSSFLLLDMTS